MPVVNPTNILISQAPDVTVIVGSGVNAREFQCYGDILAAASPFINAMLSCGMKESETKRIEFQEKDPEEFELVLQCIDNADAYLFQLYDDDDYNIEPCRDQPINFSNVRALVPWFHELRMKKYLHRCDLVASWGPWACLSNQDSVSEEEMTEFFDVLSLSIKYNLARTMEKCREVIIILTARFIWGLGDQDRFNLLIIQRMVDIFHPFQLQEVEGSQSNKLVPCRPKLINLWDCVSASLDLASLSVEIVNDEGMFPQTLYDSLHFRHLRMKSDLKRLTSDWIGQMGPFYVGDVLGNKFRISTAGTTLQESDILQHLGKFIGYRIEWFPGNNSCYELSHDMKTLCFVTNRFTIDHNIDDNKEEVEINASVAQPRQIRSSEPDLTVKIGSGDSMKEFLCHSAILASASTLLDSLISNASGVLFLPQLNPDGWDLIYEFIHPGNNGDCLNLAKYGPVEDRVRDEHRTRDIDLLLPYFQVFDMANHLMCCERILECEFDRADSFCNFEDVLHVLVLAIEHNLGRIKQSAEEELTSLFEEFNPLEFIKYVKLVTMELLVSVCLPVTRNSTQEVFASMSCPLLWEGINSRIQAHLESLSCLQIGKNEYEIFSLSRLVHCYLKMEATEN